MCELCVFILKEDTPKRGEHCLPTKPYSTMSNALKGSFWVTKSMFRLPQARCPANFIWPSGRAILSQSPWEDIPNLSLPYFKLISWHIIDS